MIWSCQERIDSSAGDVWCKHSMLVDNQPRTPRSATCGKGRKICFKPSSDLSFFWQGSVICASLLAKVHCIVPKTQHLLFFCTQNQTDGKDENWSEIHQNFSVNERLSKKRKTVKFPHNKDKSLQLVNNLILFSPPPLRTKKNKKTGHVAYKVGQAKDLAVISLKIHRKKSKGILNRELHPKTKQVTQNISLNDIFVCFCLCLKHQSISLECNATSGKRTPGIRLQHCCSRKTVLQLNNAKDGKNRYLPKSRPTEMARFMKEDNWCNFCNPYFARLAEH